MKRPIKLQQNNWSEIAGVQEPQTIRSFLGISTLDKFSIDDNYMVTNKNISTKKYPTATTREGYSVLGVPPIASPMFGSINGGNSNAAYIKEGDLWGIGASYASEFGINGEVTALTKFSFTGDFVEVTVGEYQVWGLKEDGTVWGAGDNTNGALLGVAGATEYSTLTQVPGIPIMKQISGCSYACLGLSAVDNSVWVWGSSQYGPGLVRGGTTPTYKKQVPGLPNNVKKLISNAESNHCMVLTDTRDLWVWGDNSNGACGVAIEPLTQPRLLATNVVDATCPAWGTYSCVLKDDGALWGCGEITGYANPLTTLTLLATIPNAIKITGSYWNFILTSQGNVYGWGQNFYGNLGVGGEILLPGSLLATGVLDIYEGGSGVSLILKEEGIYYSGSLAGFDGGLEIVPFSLVVPDYNPNGGSGVEGETSGLGAWKELELQAVINGEWRKWDGAAWTTLATGLNASAKWAFTNFKGNFANISLIGANGIDPVKVYNGTTVSNLANTPAGLNYVVGHSNRLYGAVGSTLHYSALRKATDWNTVDQSGVIEIETNSGENITSVVSGPGKINVFMNHSMHELYGTGPKNYQLQIISDVIGCVSHQSAITISGTLYFLSHDGLYRYNGGSIPTKDFSLPVQAVFDRVNPKAWRKVVAGTDGERYYISLPVDDGAVPSITLEYDPKFETWNMWDFGFVPSAYVRIEDAMYVGGTTGNVVKMGGETDNGSPLQYLMESKPFAYSSLAAQNRLYRLWVVADVPIGSTLIVSISSDDNDNSWTTVRTISADENVQASPILIPVNQVFHHKFVRVRLEGMGPVTIHELTRQERTFRMGIGGV